MSYARSAILCSYNKILIFDFMIDVIKLLMFMYYGQLTSLIQQILYNVPRNLHNYNFIC